MTTRSGTSPAGMTAPRPSDPRSRGVEFLPRLPDSLGRSTRLRLVHPHKAMATSETQMPGVGFFDLGLGRPQHDAATPLDRFATAESGRWRPVPRPAAASTRRARNMKAHSTSSGCTSLFTSHGTRGWKSPKNFDRSLSQRRARGECGTSKGPAGITGTPKQQVDPAQMCYDSRPARKKSTRRLFHSPVSHE